MNLYDLIKNTCCGVLADKEAILMGVRELEEELRGLREENDDLMERIND